MRWSRLGARARPATLCQGGIAYAIDRWRLGPTWQVEIFVFRPRSATGLLVSRDRRTDVRILTIEGFGDLQNPTGRVVARPVLVPTRTCWYTSPRRVPELLVKVAQRYHGCLAARGFASSLASTATTTLGCTLGATPAAVDADADDVRSKPGLQQLPLI